MITATSSSGNRVWSATATSITSRIRGLSTEVSIGPENGLDPACVVSGDNLQTVPVAALGCAAGMFYERQEAELAEALVNAFDLRVEELA